MQQSQAGRNADRAVPNACGVRTAPEAPKVQKRSRIGFEERCHQGYRKVKGTERGEGEGRSGGEAVKQDRIQLGAACQNASLVLGRACCSPTPIRQLSGVKNRKGGNLTAVFYARLLSLAFRRPRSRYRVWIHASFVTVGLHCSTLQPLIQGCSYISLVQLQRPYATSFAIETDT